MTAVMKGKPVLWIVSLLAVIAAVMWLFAPSQGPISRTAYGRIRLGMSENDVLAIMTIPPGSYSSNYSTALHESSDRRFQSDGRTQSGRRSWWISDHAMIEVEYDEQEEVCWKELHTFSIEESFHQRLRRFWWSIRRSF